jgi:hypothetical protein
VLNAASNFWIFLNSLKSSSEKFDHFLEKISKKIWVAPGELKLCMKMLYYFKLKTAY